MTSHSETRPPSLGRSPRGSSLRIELPRFLFRKAGDPSVVHSLHFLQGGNVRLPGHSADLKVRPAHSPAPLVMSARHHRGVPKWREFHPQTRDNRPHGRRMSP